MERGDDPGFGLPRRDVGICHCNRATSGTSGETLKRLIGCLAYIPSAPSTITIPHLFIIARSKVSSMATSALLTSSRSMFMQTSPSPLQVHAKTFSFSCLSILPIGIWYRSSRYPRCSKPENKAILCSISGTPFLIVPNEVPSSILQ